MSNLRNLTFEHLLIYIAIVETGSLTRAAERLGIGKTAVSKGIQRLEQELGASLIVRTTRRLSLTEAGTSFFETCRKIAQLADEAVSAVRPGADDLRGALRVAASIEYSAIVLVPVLVRMRDAHPGLRIEMVSSDRLIDTVAEGVDVTIRLGTLADSSHRAIRIGEYSKWLVASPGFVQRHALAADIRDAINAPFVGFSFLPQPSRCCLRRAEGEALELEFATSMLADTVYACRAATTEGAGIALLPDFAVRADIAAQRLLRVYAEWSSAPIPIHALLPPGRYTPPKVRALVDLLRSESGDA
jgi:DNA-binding transcriptional LysR family regulator